MTKFIDLSVFIEDNCSEPAPPKIKKVYHKPGAKIFCKRSQFNGKQVLSPDCFPNKEFLSNEVVTATTHTGTHMDSTWHYGSMCEGEKSKTIDEIPLEYFYGNGVVLDLSHKSPGSSIGVEDIKASLDNIHYSLEPRDIVLIRTGFDKKWGTPEYFTSHPGMSREATEYLVSYGIKVMGIDAYGFDRPFTRMINDYLSTGDKSFLWPSHFFGRSKEYYHMERLANLDKIPCAYGFKVACFPIKIRDTGAAWVRAVAILEE